MTDQEHASAGHKLGQLIGDWFEEFFVLPLLAIVPALLYLKMRQFGGETLNDIMAQIEQGESVHSQWQQRMRTRLTANTPRPFANTPRPPANTPPSHN